MVKCRLTRLRSNQFLQGASRRSGAYEARPRRFSGSAGSGSRRSWRRNSSFPALGCRKLRPVRPQTPPGARPRRSYEPASRNRRPCVGSPRRKRQSASRARSPSPRPSRRKSRSPSTPPAGKKFVVALPRFRFVAVAFRLNGQGRKIAPPLALRRSQSVTCFPTSPFQARRKAAHQSTCVRRMTVVGCTPLSQGWL